MIEELIEHADKRPPPPELAKLPFIEAIWPWIGAARARLFAQAAPNLALVKQKVISQFEDSLVRRWVDLCIPSIGLELETNILQGSLKGRSSKARYKYFIRRHFTRPDGLTAFFKEYEELGRTIFLFLNLWVSATSELLERLAQDLPLLSDFFNNTEPLGIVNSIENFLGDVHQGGRSVVLLHFESGKKVLYKPKDLRIVAAFHMFLNELNQLGLSPQLRGYSVLPMKGYGWEECIENRSCKNLEAVSCYFDRAGMLLCLMYLLNGIDVHKNNLIADEEFPVLIDLETLFHSELDLQLSSSHLNSSVLTTGMLPSSFALKGGLSIDLSALGSTRKKLRQSFDVVWKKLGTDQLFCVKIHARTTDCKHRVLCNGKRVSSQKYVEQIVQGFNAMYAFILQHRSYLLRADGPFALMANYPVRIVIRPTNLYSNILKKLKSAEIILNAPQIDQELDILSTHLNKTGKNLFMPLMAEEKKALRLGDIPLFTAIPSQRNVYAYGKILLEDVLPNASYDMVREKIMSLTDIDRSLQEQYIRASFGFKTRSVRKQKFKALIDPEPISQKKQMQAVLDIAMELKRHSFSLADGSLYWIVLETDPLVEQRRLCPISDRLYGGRMGLALFFAALFHNNNDPQWRSCALNCLSAMRQKIHEDNAVTLIDLLGIGGFVGVGGIIYGLVHCALLLNEYALIKEALKLASAIEEIHIQEDTKFDLIGGSAGLILGLLQLYEQISDPALLTLASSCANHLCANIEQKEIGGAWRNSMNQRCLLGFSHGTAGIAYALLKLAKYNKIDAYVETALSAMEYERFLYDKKERIWPQQGHKLGLLRDSWCNGSTGIGLGRLASLPLIHDEKMKEEVAIALKRAEEHLCNLNRASNLCCSGLGCLEFLLEASRRLKMPHLLQKVEEKIPNLFREVKNSPQEFFVPGLMQGTAGLGYTLLRIQDKSEVLPQVLLLS